MNRTLVRHLLALAVATMGVINLASALLSRVPERITAVRHLVPTDVLDTSRTFTLLAGVLLLITANGLRRGKRRAFVWALFLCALSVPVNLLKAFDFEEATVASGLMFLLGLSGDAFRVQSRELSFRGVWYAGVLLVLGVLLYAIVGCWVVERIYSPHSASFARALTEAAYQVLGVGDPTLVVPRGHHVVRWFLGSISLLSVTVLVGLLAASLQPASHRGRHRAEAERVAALAHEFGDSSVVAFTLADDVDYFFSANGRAVIAYRFESDTLLTIGDPIGPPEEVPPLLERFEQFCRDHDWQFAFYQARPERLAAYRQRGWRAVHVGEDPVLWTDRFSLEGSAMGTVRRAVRKLERAGLEARLFPPGVNGFDAANDPDGMLDQMKAISAEWVREHHGAENAFCMGRFDSAALPHVMLAVAWNTQARRVEAFCTWVPIWARRGWAIDLMRRRTDSLSGVMDFLVVRTVEAARVRGDAMLSLALSALAKVEHAVTEPAAREPIGDASVAPAGAERAAPPVTGAITDDRAREFLMERLGRFYDFKGLFRWKSKFDPAFEDRYLIYPEPLALPRIALALVRAQSPGGLLSYLRPAS